MVASAISENYLTAMRIPLNRGRVFMATDLTGGPPVALINQEVARRYWVKGDAIGQRIAFNSFATADRWFEIVGIVGKGVDLILDKWP